MFWIGFIVGGITVGGILITYGLMSISSTGSRTEEQRELEEYKNNYIEKQ